MANFNVKLIGSGSAAYQVRLNSSDGSYGGSNWYSHDYVYLWKNPSYFTQMCIPFKIPAGAENCEKLVFYSESNYFYNSSNYVSYTVNQNSQARYTYRLYNSAFYSSEYKNGTILKQGIYALNLYSVSNNGTIPIGKSASRKQVETIKFEIDVSDIVLKANDIYVFTVQYLDCNASLTEFVLDIGYNTKNKWSLYLSQDNKVIYDSNGGNVINESIKFDSSFTVTNTIPTKNDESNSSNFTITCSGGDSDITVICVKKNIISFRFLGWNTDKSATIALYTAGQVVSDLSGDIVLYAIWEQYTSDTIYSNNSLSNLPIPSKSSTSDTYIITLNTNGGTIINNELICPVTIIYVFKEWVDADNQPINKDAQFYEDTTVYATWEKYASGSVELPIPKKQGNIFLGWKESEEATDFVSNVYAPKEDCTLYAIYKVGYLVEAYIRLSNKWVKINMD